MFLCCTPMPPTRTTTPPLLLPRMQLPFALFAVVVADAVVAPLATARLLLAVRANYIAPVRDVWCCPVQASTADSGQWTADRPLQTADSRLPITDCRLSLHVAVVFVIVCRSLVLLLCVCVCVAAAALAKQKLIKSQRAAMQLNSIWLWHRKLWRRQQQRQRQRRRLWLSRGLRLRLELSWAAVVDII